jgi:uncharacterized membrane protein YdjX (TVP38/TMEM64 family)
MSARSAIRGLVVTAVCALLFAAYRTGLLHRLEDPEGLRRALLDQGAWGYVAFVVAYATLQPFGVPGTIFIGVAPLVWPWPQAFALSMVGTMAASIVGFTFARFVARDWVSPRIPERFRRYEDALERRGVLTVFVLRFIFWMPPLLHAFFGVSRVSFAAHFWGSLLGYVIPILLVSVFGLPLFELARRLPASAWVAMGLVIAVGLLAAFLLRRPRRAGSSTASPSAPGHRPEGGGDGHLGQ